MSDTPVTATAMRDPLGLVGLLILLMGVGAVATGIYLPSLPAMRAELGATVWEAQLTLTVFFIGYAGAQLVTGPLSDRFGRRPTVLGGMAVFFVASVGCALADDVTLLSVARFFQAAGACASIVIPIAVARDRHGPAGAARLMATLAMATSLAPALGPVIGGYLEVGFGWRASFVFLAAYGAVLILWIWFGLAETNRHRDPYALHPVPMLRNYGTLLRHRVFLGYVACAGFQYAIIFTFVSGSSPVLIDLFGVAPDAFGYYYGAVFVGYTIGAALTRRLTRRFGIERSAFGGTATLAAGTVAMPVLALAGIDNVWAIVVPMFVFMVGMGIAYPNALAGAVGPFPRIAGAASALMGFLFMSLAAVGGSAVGALYDRSQMPLAVIVAILGVASLLSYWLLIWRHRSPAVD